MDAYGACNKIEPSNERASEGMKKSMEAISNTNTGNGMADVMVDPEVQALLQDPEICEVITLM